jgi:hypothetical protein
MSNPISQTRTWAQVVAGVPEPVVVVEVEAPPEVPQPTFHGFLLLPAELRIAVIHEYLVLEREAGRLSKHCHYDRFFNRCCVWEYPDLLIACDNQEPNTFPLPETARAPVGWLPAMAFTNKTVLGEVVVHMLQNTERIDLKYIWENPGFKIAIRFRNFLAAIPGGDGLNAVKYLNFPHTHWFNSEASSATPTNPSIELMTACLNLRKVDMTFHASRLEKPSELEDGTMVPCTALDLVEHFKFWPILDCEQLQEIYFDGIYVGVHGGGSLSDLDPLEYLAKWLIKGFLVRRDQNVQVEVGRRWGCWTGRVAGKITQLDDEDMEEVARKIENHKGEMLDAAAARGRCAYPLLM